MSEGLRNVDLHAAQAGVAEALMSGPRRLAIFLSALWVGFWVWAYLTDTRPFMWDGFLMFGIAPVALVWGIAWVVAGFRSRGG